MNLCCPLCAEAFTPQARRPMLLPCGHTLCLACVHRTFTRQCPDCRKTWEQSAVVNNFYVLRLVNNAAGNSTPPGQWCLECQAPASLRCRREHDVRNPKALLRQSLRDVVPQAKEQLHGLQDDVKDGDALTALKLLHGARATCKLSLVQDDGEAVDAEWSVGEGPLLQTLVAVLAAKGRLVPLQEPEVSAPEPPTSQRINKLDVGISWTYPRQRREEKADMLARVLRQGVRRMESVACDADRAWALELLRAAAPRLEELHVHRCRKEHLRAVLAMPRLQRLLLDYNDVDLEAQSALPRASLKWLRACNVPRRTLVSLLQAHSVTLDVLWLQVGTPGTGGFPNCCNDLDAILGQSGLRSTRVLLWRNHCSHNQAACSAQVTAVRRMLPNVTVQCHACDEVAFEYF